jgi:hypothetical protein
MELQHVNVKLFVQDPEKLDLERFVPIFHGWIQEQGSDELLLDVADYRHLPAGPGVVLIGHQANYSVDNTGNRLGVRYNRKAALEGGNLDRFAQATRAALLACRRLESDPRVEGRMRFNGREIELFINDRLLAPNAEETRAAAEPEVRQFFRNLFAGSDFSLAYSNGDPRRLFSVTAESARPFTIEDLLENLQVASR